MRIERPALDDVEALPTRLIGVVSTIGVALLWVLLALLLSTVPSGAGQTIMATIAIPCLTGVTWICLDMATDMALGRAVSRIRTDR